MEIDDQLQTFFRNAVPSPWPECPRPARQVRRLNSTRTLVRYALAASVALMLAGYLSIANFFPRDASSPLESQGTIGQKQGHKIDRR